MARSLMFLAWMIVLWGSVLVMAFAWKAIGEGWGPALAAILPVGRQDGWAWLNLACGVLAVCVWSVAAVVLVRLRRD
jgi:hypothetical protein